MNDAIGTQSLLQIYGVYDKLKGSQKAAGASPSSTAGAGAGPSAKEPSQDNTAAAEAEKSHGNAAMARKDYPAAITFYTKALALAPTNPIYLSNRAAAYSATHDHTAAVADAEMAVAADPKYTKAWSRLGLARFVLGDARGSMEAYQAGIEAEGNGGSEAMRKGFKTAKEKVEEQERELDAAGMAEGVDEDSGAARAPPGGGGGGMPDLSALAGMMGGGGGGGGMPDMSAIMSNPMFASMAQNLMRNPEALQGLMNNPQLRGMAERFGVGGAGGGAPAAEAGTGAGRGGAPGGGAAGGGMPDFASMMQDPAIAEM